MIKYFYPQVNRNVYIHNRKHTYLLKICARIFTATLFALAPNERQLKCPSGTE